MPFIPKDEKNGPEGHRPSNFPLTEEFEWIVNAKKAIEEMVQENLKGPIELLNKYK